MVKTFEHLLGLNTKTALALLSGYGITDVRVTLTGAPPLTRRAAPDALAAPDAPAPRPERVSALEGIFHHFSVNDGDDGEEGTRATFNPLTDPSLDEGMLVESRVVAVRNDGRQLLVARFHVGDPRPRAGKVAGDAPPAPGPKNADEG